MNVLAWPFRTLALESARRLAASRGVLWSVGRTGKCMLQVFIAFGVNLKMLNCLFTRMPMATPSLGTGQAAAKRREAFTLFFRTSSGLRQGRRHRFCASSRLAKAIFQQPRRCPSLTSLLLVPSLQQQQGCLCETEVCRPFGMEARLFIGLSKAERNVLPVSIRALQQCMLPRQKIFPIPREGLTAQLLDEEVRFRRLREDSDGCPVPGWQKFASRVDTLLLIGRISEPGCYQCFWARCTWPR